MFLREESKECVGHGWFEISCVTSTSESVEEFG